MPKIIYKYGPVYHNMAPGNKPFMIPADAKFVHTAIQNNQVYVWAEVTVMPDSTPRYTAKSVVLEYYGTGEEYCPNLTYVGTVLTPGGFVWHVTHNRPLLPFSG